MMQIRSVCPSLLHRAFLEAFADYAMDVSGATEEHLLLRMRKNRVDYEVSPGLYDGDRLVGFTLIGVDEWDGQTTAFDAGTGIVPAHRNQAWAKKMFDHALPALHERGVKQFVLEALRENEAAIRAYQKSGFHVTRELRCYKASTEGLRRLPGGPFPVRAADSAILSGLHQSADWTPSFENRFAASAAVPEHVVTYGAFDGTRCLGLVSHLPALNWLLTLLVHPECRRQGIGSSLLGHLAASLPRSVMKLAVLNVDAADEGMQKFLLTLGFSRFAVQVEMRREI